MEWALIRADWEKCGAAVQDRWGRITEEDLTVAQAGRDELVGCVLKRYRMEQSMAERQVDDWINSWG